MQIRGNLRLGKMFVIPGTANIDKQSSEDLQRGKLIFFIRQGPAEDNVRILQELQDLKFRVMPSLYYAETEHRGVVVPMLDRMLLAVVKPLMSAPMRDGRESCYRIKAELKSSIVYNNLMRLDSPLEWRRHLQPGSLVDLYYNCEDRVGELVIRDEPCTIPFPVDVQRIRNERGDYHVVWKM